TPASQSNHTTNTFPYTLAAAIDHGPPPSTMETPRSMKSGSGPPTRPRDRRKRTTAPSQTTTLTPPSRWLKIATIALAAACLLGLFSTAAADTDFWWHLKTGQYIVQHHPLPIPDPFAYTTATNPIAYPGEDQVRR